MREAHELGITRSNTRPTRVIFFDTETTPIAAGEGRTQHKLKLGYAKMCRRTDDEVLDPWRDLVFSSPGELWSKLDGWCKKKSTTYLVAHNLIFDLAVTHAFKEMSLAGWELRSFYSKGMVSIFRWKHGERRLIALDNGNFFSGKLDTWGERIGIRKLPIDFETCSPEELLTYCKRDVEIMVQLWRSWISFLDHNQCGAFKPTVASTAFNAWRHRFLKTPIWIHDHADAIALERESYHGGRTECLWVGRRDDGPFYYLDVNNMYGFILQTRSFPASLWGYRDQPASAELAYKLKRYAVIARVTLEVDQPWYPIVDHGFTTFPVGSFITTLTTPELKLALDRGWLREVHAMSWYRPAVLFKDYVSFFSQVRSRYQLEHKDGWSQIAKLLVNGLYGKFGQKGVKQELIGDCSPDEMSREQVYDLQSGQYYDIVKLAGKIFRESRQGESYHSFPAIAAHVTAYARMYLAWLRFAVPQEHVFYLDTDSLIVDQVGYDALRFYMDPHKLGMLKVEARSPWLEISAAKDYKMEMRTRQKGISPMARELADGVWMQTQWVKLGGLMRANYATGYFTQEVTKKIQREIHSGRLQQDGWILPFELVSSQEAVPF